MALSVASEVPHESLLTSVEGGLKPFRRRLRSPWRRAVAPHAKNASFLTVLGHRLDELLVERHPALRVERVDGGARKVGTAEALGVGPAHVVDAAAVGLKKELCGLSGGGQSAAKRGGLGVASGSRAIAQKHGWTRGGKRLLSRVQRAASSRQMQSVAKARSGQPWRPQEWPVLDTLARHGKVAVVRGRVDLVAGDAHLLLGAQLAA